MYYAVLYMLLITILSVLNVLDSVNLHWSQSYKLHAGTGVPVL